ncbi:MAG TPA: hypothetical protein VMH61_06275 [Candidatus Acidoferrales bacterium]|nr:hypothetical protein [Candidatus Acidoferrales bacterium]
MNAPQGSASLSDAAFGATAGAFLVATLFASAQRHAAGAIRTCRLQALALAAAALAAMATVRTWPLALVVLLVVAGKVVLVPALLARHAARTPTSGHDAPSGVAGGALAAAALAGVALLALVSPQAGVAGAPGAAIALASVLAGLLVLALRGEETLRLAGLGLASNGALLGALALAPHETFLLVGTLLLDVPIALAGRGPRVAGRERAADVSSPGA